MSQSDTHEVRDAETEAVLGELGAYIGGKLPPGFAFSLLVFTLEPGATSFYISNAERRTTLMAMQEFIRSYKQRGH